MPSVLAIVLNWNSGPDAVACLAALERSTFGDCRVLVVDNGSTDDSLAQIAARYPQVERLALPANLGYAAGNNRGIAHGLGAHDYVWLLNPDVTVAPECLAALLETAEALPRAAMLGPVVFTRERPDCILSAGGLLVDGIATHRGTGAGSSSIRDAVTQVDYITGCALLVRRSALETIGPLDERFFLYWEEVDWCQRARAADFTCVIVPRAHVWHPDTRSRDAFSPVVTYYAARNQLLFLRKHRMGTAMLVRHLLRHARTLASWTVRPKWRAKRAQRRALQRALIDFARGRVGPAAQRED